MAPPTGYSFKSALTFEQIRARLAELGHGTWEVRDSDTYGTYLRQCLTHYGPSGVKSDATI